MRLKDTFRGLRKYHNIVTIVFIFCMMASFSFLATRGAKNSSAVSSAGFRPGNIISDSVMGNYRSMSVQEIQNFLTSKNRCTNTNYNQYLSLKSQYKNTDWHFENGHFVCLSEERFGDGTTIGSGQTAAEVIYQAAQDYRINPQVLIVLLEKEQGLISDTFPNSIQYRSATGFGCPDTAACSTEYYGFKNQVRQAAKMFRSVLDGGWSNYPVGKTSYIQYNPNKACGGTNVYIENRATSALYRYTPYQPNASALNAGYGTGDSCGAYGNRNFYLFYSDWFGNPSVSVNGERISLPEGEYFFVSQLSNSLALGVASGNGNGTNIQMVNYNPSDPRQKWRVQKTSDGYYQLIHVATGKALDVNNSVVEGNNITLWNPQNSCNQKWRIYSTGNDNLAFESACSGGMVMDLFGGVGKAGSNVAIWTVHNGKGQHWALRTGKTLEEGLYTVTTTKNDNKVLDANGAYTGANVSIWDKHGKTNQSWAAKYNSEDDTYTFINPMTGKVLDASNSKAANGTNVALWTKNGGNNQKWKVIPQGDGTYAILSMCSLGYALDLNNASIKNGTNISLWESHGGDPQTWRFNKHTNLVPGQTYTIVAKANSNMALDINNNNFNDGTNITLWSNSNGANQRWQIVHNARTNDYTLKNPHSGKVLDIAGKKSGSNVGLWQANDGCNQRWKINLTKDGYYEFTSVCDTNLALDMDGGGTYDGTNILVWTRHGGDSQKFTLAQ